MYLQGLLDDLKYDARFRLTVLVGVAAVAVLGAWLLLLRGDGSASGAGEPTTVSAEELQDFADSAELPVYWAGERRDAELELTETEDGRVYVRYLTGGAEVGDESSALLTVGTYPMPDALASLEAIPKEETAFRGKADGEGLVVATQAQPNSVYVAYPDSDYQVEVYDEEPAHALEVALSGQVVPVGS